MLSWAIVVVVIYAISTFFIFFYSLVQLNLVIRYKRQKIKVSPKEMPDAQLPKVLIQLPVYNERYVVERLIDAAANLDYPVSKLEIQLLDDSSDESFGVATKRVAYWASRGLQISQVARPDREGFKAGALSFGLAQSSASFVAVFDADFVPSPDFLKRTIPYFQNSELGMVQTRWEHLNRDYSLLTRVQAFALDAHFTVEQTGRNAGDHFINFNGTAGIWRKQCIQDAGGWSADTLTEDLDLSYRAQLKGWKFLFLETLGSPAELPAELNALKNQQYRWNKGAAECAKKHLGKVFLQRGITLSTRIHAVFHLMNSSIFIWIVACAVLSLPLVLVKNEYPQFKSLFLLGSVLLFSFVVLAYFYYTSFRRMEIKRAPSQFFWLYPAFLSISMGMSLHNARAVILGFAGKKTPFIRTPKWSLVGKSGTLKNKAYIATEIKWLTWLEGLLCLYFSWSLYYEILIGEWGFVLLHLMLIFGFATVFIYALKQNFQR